MSPERPQYSPKPLANNGVWQTNTLCPNGIVIGVFWAPGLGPTTKLTFIGATKPHFILYDTYQVNATL